MISFRKFLTEGTLQKSNLNRKPDRIQILVKKLQNREPFVLKGQTKPTLVIDPDPQWLNDLMTSGQLKADYILDINGQRVPLSSLQKTTEFGSTGRMGTEKEAVQLNRLDQLIKEANGGDPIDIKIGNKIYKNCVGARNTPGTPKSDFELVDDAGRSVAFISHKDGMRANDFGQWSGMTDYKDYPEVQKFIKDVIRKVGKVMPNKTTLARPLRDLNLKNKACFGKDFGARAFSVNNVTCIIQGEVRLVPKGNYFILEGGKMWLSGKTPTDEYDPALMAIYKGDRDNFGIKGARFSIYPIGGRKNITI